MDMTQTSEKTRAAVQAPAISPQQIEQYRLEEPSLIERWKETGDETALRVLIERYQSLVHAKVAKVARSHALTTSHRDDLLQEATLALVKAISGFEPDKAPSLGAYAGNLIQNALRRYVLDNRYSYRIGTSSSERKALYAAFELRREKLRDGHETPIGDAEIAELQRRTGAPHVTTKRAVEITESQSVALDDAAEHPALGQEGAEHSERLSFEKAIAKISPFIATLCPRERRIFESYLSDQDFNAREIAAEFGITPERIGQIRRLLFERLRDHLTKSGIHAADLF